MDERMIQAPIEEGPSAARRMASVSTPAISTGDGLSDSRALLILTTEHSSLQSARSLVYNEAFTRAGMFLTFLSSTLVVLGLVSAGIGFRREFLLVAAGILALDLFIGLATLGRLVATTSEDLRYLQGMNRLRHAYHEILPGLEPYFVSGRHDDLPGIIGSVYSASRPMSRRGILHGLTTTAGMITVICGTIGAALAGVLVLLATDAPAVAALIAIIVLATVMAAGFMTMNRRIVGLARQIESRFPTPEA